MSKLARGVSIQILGKGSFIEFFYGEGGEI
jgi:hypothetical protein